MHSPCRRRTASASEREVVEQITRDTGTRVELERVDAACMSELRGLLLSHGGGREECRRADEPTGQRALFTLPVPWKMRPYSVKA